MNYKKTSAIAVIFLLSVVFVFGLKTLFLAKNTEHVNAKAEKNIAGSKQKENTVSGPLPVTSAVPKPQNTGKIIRSAPTGQKIVALTFDADMTDGMEYNLKTGKIKSWYNEAVIKELERTQTPATLFLAGLWIKNYPDVTKELAANPLFEIANHSYSHSAFSFPCFGLATIPDSSDEREINKTDELLKLYAPNYKKYFRFPGLCYDDFDIQEAQRLGYQVIDGSIRGLDGFTYDANEIVSRVVSQLAPGGIIILHIHGAPNAPRTAEALPQIIRQAEEKGYQFVKISELLNL